MPDRERKRSLAEGKRLHAGLQNDPELLALLRELSGWEALELDFSEVGDGIIRIPYVMNDAAESYLELSGCDPEGEWDPAFQGELQISLTRHENRRQLLLQQEEEGYFRRLRIFFSQAELHICCYRYHRIGHAWRKLPGEEPFRRLVHLVCVLHDKYTYLGEAGCNEAEKSLSALAEYGPFRYWTPINESILDWYPDSRAGAEAALRLSREAGCEELSKSVRAYEKQREEGTLRDEALMEAAEAFLCPKAYGFYEKLLEKLEEASALWPERKYPDKQQEEMDGLRREKLRAGEEEGYRGEYPLLRKTEKDRELTLRFVEEQPFTVLEAEEYGFRIFEERTERRF